MNVWLGWLNTLLQLDSNGKYLCGVPNTGERLLLIGKTGEAQVGQNDIFIKDGQSPGYSFIITVDVSAYPYVT